MCLRGQSTLIGGGYIESPERRYDEQTYKILIYDVWESDV